MTSKENSLNWFEISVKDIKRAKKFYETIFGIKMPEMEMMGMQMAFFPSEPKSGKANGGLCQSKMHKPSKSGAKIYLNANPGQSHKLYHRSLVQSYPQVKPTQNLLAEYNQVEHHKVLREVLRS